jgi:putative secretory antigen
LTASVGNRYAAGNCTWYAYERRLQLGRPIGSFWGNANTWATSARAAGFVVNNTPAPGAIFQTTAGYYGHVGIVERVENGVVYVSDMNYAGYGIITHRTLNGAGGYLYIH